MLSVAWYAIETRQSKLVRERRSITTPWLQANETDNV